MSLTNLGYLLIRFDLILRNADRIGEMIEEITGQKKYLEALPYFPQCEKCGRLNVARPYKYDPSEKKGLLQVFRRRNGKKIHTGLWT